MMFLAVAHGEAQARSVVLRRGQVVPIEAVQEITSKTAHPGDRVPLRVTRDLVADGMTVLPEGSILYGRVTEANPAGKNCHDGRLHWKLEIMPLASGQKIRTRFVPDYIPAGGPIPDRVSLPSGGHKIGHGGIKVAEMSGLTVFVVALSPLLIPMGIAMSEPCRGSQGDEKMIREGEHFFIAVSKTVKIAQ